MRLFASACPRRMLGASAPQESILYGFPCAAKKLTGVCGLVARIVASYGMHLERDGLLMHFEQFFERFICHDILIHAFTT